MSNFKDWGNITLPSLPEKRYKILYCDPPYDYRLDRAKTPGNATYHYPCIPTHLLKRIPFWNIAAEDSILFLWTSYPKFPDALELIKAWGFTYKTVAFTWVKTRNKKPITCLGRWTLSNPEICLLATQGKPERKCSCIKQLIFAPRSLHSSKPPEARRRIEKLMGDLPRIELFAREHIQGWDAWGQQAPPDTQQLLDIESTDRCHWCGHWIEKGKELSYDGELYCTDQCHDAEKANDETYGT